MYLAYRVTEDEEILNATPAELVLLLYAGAVTAVEQAREALRQGDVLARGTRITKAVAIVLELAASLNHSKGGEISKRLADIYQYILTALSEAHRNQDEAKLLAVESILRTLQEGWQNTQSSPPIPVVGAYGKGMRLPGVYV
jgi:flagellar protein FliS